jgi:hypothetical protein
MKTPAFALSIGFDCRTLLLARSFLGLTQNTVNSTGMSVAI